MFLVQFCLKRKMLVVFALLFVISQAQNLTIFTFASKLECLKFDFSERVSANPVGLLFQTYVAQYTGCVSTVNGLAKYEITNGSVTVYACALRICNGCTKVNTFPAHCQLDPVYNAYHSYKTNVGLLANDNSINSVSYPNTDCSGQPTYYQYFVYPKFCLKTSALDMGFQKNKTNSIEVCYYNKNSGCVGNKVCTAFNKEECSSNRFASSSLKVSWNF